MRRNPLKKLHRELFEEIKKKYHNRCIRCNRKVPLSPHELDTRGNGGAGAINKDNIVPLCGKCHAWATNIGTLNSMPILISYREKRCPPKPVKSKKSKSKRESGRKITARNTKKSAS